MIPYQTNSTIDAIGARIRAASSVVVLTHAKPDGDAMGSVLAAVRTVRALGISAQGCLVGPIDPNLLTLSRCEEARLLGANEMPHECDLVLLVDTGAWSQVEPLGGWLRDRHSIVLGLDHHARGDEIASLRVVDSSAASATEVVTRLVDALGVDLRFGGDSSGRYSVAEALFTGLATDTGWFRFSSAGDRAFTLAARLLSVGVDKQHLLRQLEENERAERLAATGRALQSLRWIKDGRVAIMRLSSADLKETRANPEDLGGIVNVPLAVGRVAMSILLTESEPNLTKMSLRSKPKPCGAPSFDVNKIAAHFGGGGHVQAAGARQQLPLDQAVEALEAFVNALEEVS
ncbi:MAG: bifunctional oligoribonuclease/PAP phosphatase NrnA [Planctomycetota bacterium]|nr:bifunctional oligoribonuclease/PAP phosphatase NrnA [Planctomycetota bacterium]